MEDKTTFNDRNSDIKDFRKVSEYCNYDDIQYALDY
jgi:hypothetical protein